MIEVKSAEVRPFLKWAGGKRWLAERLRKELPQNYTRYIEPFVGGGAVFFTLNPKRAILGDYNEWLIETYQAIKDDWRTVLSRLRVHDKKHGKKYYYDIRRKEYPSRASRAAKLIYLNRACWNGLFRVDKNGNFNVPKGTAKSIIRETDSFKEIADRLQSAKLISGDFKKTISLAEKGDFIYADPPYITDQHRNGFVGYNNPLFEWKDQIRLSEELYTAYKKGSKIIVSNISHKSVRDLYSSWCRIETISRMSLIGGIGSFRGDINEFLIISNK